MTATAVYEQLTFAIELELLDAAREATALEAGLRDRRRVPLENGPARLLRELVLRGLPPESLRPAAALCLAADQAAAERAERKRNTHNRGPGPPGRATNRKERRTI